MPTVLTEQYAMSAEEPPSGVSPAWLFVSTSLSTWNTARPEQFARDFQLNDTVYRRLDPEYYAWLRSRMALAKHAATAGHLPPTAFEGLRLRFNAVHERAVHQFGEAPLLAAVRTLSSREYKPPIAEAEGQSAPATFTRKAAADDILRDSMALVDSISEQALSLGWKRHRLYADGNSRMFAPELGLVCLLKVGDRIGEVTRQSIEIIGPPPMEVRRRFYNPDVEQPWVRRLT